MHTHCLAIQSPGRLHPGASQLARGLRLARLFTLLAFLADDAHAQQTTQAAFNSVATVVATSPYERIVMMGASVTAGFTETEPFGGPKTAQLRLSRYVDAALIVPHEPVKNLGNPFFFLQPEPVAQKQIEQALTNRPTLIVGLDFLFWFLYGEGSTDEDRLKRFDRGLKQLEAVDCRLVLGDIPDASAAVNGMLRPEQMPGLEAIAAANRRLNAWAAGRQQVRVVKLSEFMRHALANRAIKLRSHTVPDGQTRPLLQNDKLHASPEGCATLALAALETVQSVRPATVAEAFRRDPKEITRVVMESLKAASDRDAKPAASPAPGAE